MGNIAMTGMYEDSDGVRRVQGQVKWFNPHKGFGFIVSDEGGPDIMLHANVLRNYGISSISENCPIEIYAQNTKRGFQALQIIEISSPESGERNESSFGLGDFDESGMKSLPLLPARVKWFDKLKGYGFANIFGRGDDVFIHMDVVRRCGMSNPQPGEALAIRVKDGRRGQMALEICEWESANSQPK